MSDNGACGHCGSLCHTDVDCEEWYADMDHDFEDYMADDMEYDYAGDY